MKKLWVSLEIIPLLCFILVPSLLFSAISIDTKIDLSQEIESQIVNCIPEDAVFLFQIRAIDEFCEKWKATSLSKLYQSPELSSISDFLNEIISENQKKIERQINLTNNALRDLFHREILFALIESDKYPQGYKGFNKIFIAEFRGDQKNLEDILFHIFRQNKSMNPSLKRDEAISEKYLNFEIKGIEYQVRRPFKIPDGKKDKNAPSPPIKIDLNSSEPNYWHTYRVQYTFHNNYFFLAEGDVDFLKNILKNYTNIYKKDVSLLDFPSTPNSLTINSQSGIKSNTLKQLLNKSQKDYDAYFYLNLKKILSLALDDSKRNILGQNISLKNKDLNDFTYFGGEIRLNENDIICDGILGFSDTAGRRSLLRILNFKNLSSFLSLNFAPEDTNYFQCINVDLKEVWYEIKNFLKNALPKTSEILETFLTNLSLHLSVDIEKDIIQQISGEIAKIRLNEKLSPYQNQGKIKGRDIFLLQIKNPEEFKKTIEKLKTSPSLSTLFSLKKNEKSSFDYYLVCSPRTNDLETTSTTYFSLAIMNNFLILSQSETTLVELLNFVKNSDRNTLKNNIDFKALLEKVPFSEKSFIFYIKAGELSVAFIQSLGVIQEYLGGKKDFVKNDVRKNISEDIFEKYFNGLIGTTQTLKSGIRIFVLLGGKSGN